MKFIPSLLFAGILLISGCTQKALETTFSTESNQPAPPPPPQSYTKEAKLIAVGDIMMHSPQTRSGYDPQRKTYDFKGFFTEVKDILSQGDWVIGNLETPLAGAESGYTGYPLFNAPAELADAIKNAGFNILTTANNHALDRGEKGLIKTIENLRDRGLLSAGTATSAAEAEKILMVEKNNIKMAILSYSYGTNGIPIPKGKNYLVNLIDEKKIVKDIGKAREQGADVITVCLHFGDEYQRQPNTQQKNLVDSLIKAGADIILGSHPHVVQPYKIFEVPGKNGKPRKAVAIYSMGNFISNQTRKYTDIGVIFEVGIRKKFPENTVEIADVNAIPTWVHRYALNGKLNFRVLPIETVVSAKKDKILAKRDYPVLASYLREMKTHLNSMNTQKEKALAK